MTDSKTDKRFVLNYKRDVKDPRDFKFKLAAPVKLLPRVDLTSSMPPVLNQGQLGSCTSNALANGIRFALQKEKIAVISPSRLFIYYNGRVISHEPIDEDTGLSLRTACKSVAKYKVCGENNWPYDIEKFAVKPSDLAYKVAASHKKFKYEALEQNFNALAACICDGYPFVLGITVYSSFMSPEVEKSGTVPMPSKKDKEEGGHAIICCGYDSDKRVFICQNSWGKEWGKNGFFTLPFDYVLNADMACDFWKVSQFV